MINTATRSYGYYLYEDENAYGQAQLSKDIVGYVKMAIYTTNQTIQDNIRYKGCEYIGLTLSTVTDKHVIAYGQERLKVLYVQPNGRYKQVYLARM